MEYSKSLLIQQGFENPEFLLFQEVDARICSKISSKTPDSLHMIAPGTQSSFWIMFLNGFPGKVVLLKNRMKQGAL